MKLATRNYAYWINARGWTGRSAVDCVACKILIRHEPDNIIASKSGVPKVHFLGTGRIYKTPIRDGSAAIQWRRKLQRFLAYTVVQVIIEPYYCLSYIHSKIIRSPGVYRIVFSVDTASYFKVSTSFN